MVYGALTNANNFFTTMSNVYGGLGGVANVAPATVTFFRLIRYQRQVAESSPFRAIPLESDVQGGFRTSWK